MDTPDKPDRRADDPVIDLRESDKRSMGDPANCPECGGRGFLDSINLRREMQYEHCKACGHAWSTSFAELAPRASS